MDWLQQNWLALAMGVLFAYLFLWDRIMAAILGVRVMNVHDLSAHLGSDQPPLLVDVRTPREFDSGHIRQALPAPLGELRARAKSIVEKNPGRPVAVICQSGNRSLKGAVSFRRAGAETVYNVVGGIAHWRGQGYALKR